MQTCERNEQRRSCVAAVVTLTLATSLPHAAAQDPPPDGEFPVVSRPVAIIKNNPGAEIVSRQIVVINDGVDSPVVSRQIVVINDGVDFPVVSRQVVVNNVGMGALVSGQIVFIPSSNRISAVPAVMEETVPIPCCGCRTFIPTWSSSVFIIDGGS